MITAKITGTAKEIAETLRNLAFQHDMLAIVTQDRLIEFEAKTTVLEYVGNCAECLCPVTTTDEGHSQQCTKRPSTLTGNETLEQLHDIYQKTKRYDAFVAIREYKETNHV